MTNVFVLLSKKMMSNLNNTVQGTDPGIADSPCGRKTAYLQSDYSCDLAGAPTNTDNTGTDTDFEDGTSVANMMATPCSEAHASHTSVTNSPNDEDTEMAGDDRSLPESTAADANLLSSPKIEKATCTGVLNLQVSVQTAHSLQVT